MILSARKCGCPVHAQRRPSSSSCSVVNLNSPQTCLSTQTTSGSSCICESDKSTCETEPKSKRILSEIATKGQPYKEVETIFNDSRIILRLQKEKSKEEFDPPCDCIQPIAKKSSSINVNDENQRNDAVLQKSSSGCRTISVYPNPDQKGSEFRKGEIELPTVNPEENPNIFVLKIKRKCNSGDKKHNLNLEFRSPRPWRKQKCKE